MRPTCTRVPLDQAPDEGEIRIVDIGAHRIGLLRVGDEFFALADRCPHRGAPLCSSGRAVHGVGLKRGIPTRGAHASALRCPWHKWDFDIATGECLAHPRMKVRRYRVVREVDELVISLEHPSYTTTARRSTSRGHPHQSAP